MIVPKKKDWSVESTNLKAADILQLDRIGFDFSKLRQFKIGETDLAKSSASSSAIKRIMEKMIEFKNRWPPESSCCERGDLLFFIRKADEKVVSEIFDQIKKRQEKRYDGRLELKFETARRGFKVSWGPKEASQ